MSISDYIVDIFKNPERYTKFWIAFATAVMSLASTYFTDAVWLPTLIQFMGVYGVFAGKNVKGVK